MELRVSSYCTDAEMMLVTFKPKVSIQVARKNEIDNLNSPNLMLSEYVFRSHKIYTS